MKMKKKIDRMNWKVYVVTNFVTGKFQVIFLLRCL